MPILYSSLHLFNLSLNQHPPPSLSKISFSSSVLGIRPADSAYHLRSASLRQSFWPWPCAADGRRLNEACGTIYGASFTGWFGGWLQVLRDSPWICLKTWLTDTSTICDWGFRDCSSCFSNELFFSHWLSSSSLWLCYPKRRVYSSSEWALRDVFWGFALGGQTDWPNQICMEALCVSFSSNLVDLKEGI